jgi:hypothetical protein
VCRPRPGLRCNQRASEILRDASQKAVQAQNEYKQLLDTRNSSLLPLAVDHPDYDADLVSELQKKKKSTQLNTYLEQLAVDNENYEPLTAEETDQLSAALDKVSSTRQDFDNACNERKMTPTGIQESLEIANDPEAPYAQRVSAAADAEKAMEVAEYRKAATELLNDPELSNEERLQAAQFMVAQIEKDEKAAQDIIDNVQAQDEELLRQAGINPNELAYDTGSPFETWSKEKAEWVAKHPAMEHQDLLVRMREQSLERAKANEGKLALKQLTMKQALRHGLSREQYERLLHKRMLLFKQGMLAESDLKFRGVVKAAIKSWAERRFKNIGNLFSQSTLHALTITEKLGTKIIGYTTGGHRGARRHHGKWGGVLANPQHAAFKKSLRDSMIPRIMAKESEDMVDNVKIAEDSLREGERAREAARAKIGVAYDRAEEAAQRKEEQAERARQQQYEREQREAEKERRRREKEDLGRAKGEPVAEPTTGGSEPLNGPTPSSPEN